MDQRTAPTTDLGKGLQALQDAKPNYAKALDYYQGTLPEVFADQRLRAAIRRAGFSLNFNFSHNIVDAVSDRLEITAVTSDEDSPNTLIGQIWDDNDMDLQAPRTMRKAGTFGDAYVLVWPADGAEDVDGDPDDDSATEGDLPTRKLKIRYQDPQCVRMMYEDDDPLEPSYAVKTWSVEAPHPLMVNPAKTHYVDLYYRDRIEHYETRPGAKGHDENDYIPSTTADTDGDNDAPAHPAVEENPFGAIPVFHLRTGADCYGDPEHEQAFSAQDAIHEAVLDLMTTLAYTGFPQRYRLLAAGADTSQSAMGDEGQYTYALEPAGSTRNMLNEPQSQLKASAGSMWDLTQTTSVGQFEASDSTTFLNTINSILRYMGIITNTPFSRLDPSGQIQSGEALRTLEAPFVKKVRNRQISYGATWSRIFQFALQVLGFDNAKVTISWAPAASIDDSDTWALVKAKQDNGVPAAVTLTEAGYAAETVNEWLKDSGFVLQQKMQVLTQLGEFLAAAGTAVAAGAIGPDSVQQVIDNVIADLAVEPDAS